MRGVGVAPLPNFSRVASHACPFAPCASRHPCQIVLFRASLFKRGEGVAPDLKMACHFLCLANVPLSNMVSKLRIWKSGSKVQISCHVINDEFYTLAALCCRYTLRTLCCRYTLRVRITLVTLCCTTGLGGIFLLSHYATGGCFFFLGGGGAGGHTAAPGD